MCYPSGTKFSSAADAAAALSAMAAQPKKFDFLYATENGVFKSCKAGAVRDLLESAYESSADYVTYSHENTPFAILFDRSDASDVEIVQVNLVSGTARRIIRREIITNKVFHLDLPHHKAERVEAEKAAEELRVANLKAIPSPVYTELTWTVESTDVHRPHPFVFERDGQAALEAAFQSFLAGGFHLYAHSDYLIDFKSMTQTNKSTDVVRKLERVDPLVVKVAEAVPSL
jgi:hypothetical protein